MNQSLERKRNKGVFRSGLCSGSDAAHTWGTVVTDASGLLQLWLLLPLRGAIELCGWMSRSHNTRGMYWGSQALTGAPRANVVASMKFLVFHRQHNGRG